MGVLRSLLTRAPADNGSLVGAITPDVGGYGVDAAPGDVASYYARSVGVYACVKLRSDALAKPALRIGVARGDDIEEVPRDHWAASLFRGVNPFWTRSRLWRHTETSLSLRGSAFWGIARDRSGRDGVGRPDLARTAA